MGRKFCISAAAIAAIFALGFVFALFLPVWVLVLIFAGALAARQLLR